MRSRPTTKTRPRWAWRRRARARTRLAEVARPQQLLFATATPPYLDKTNAKVIHAALRSRLGALAVDMARLGPLRASAPSCWRPSHRYDPPWRCSPTSAPDCRAAPTSATAVTARPLSSSARPRLRCSPSSSRRPRRPRSSSTAGGFRERSVAGRGRSGSASTPTLPLADAAFADALKQADLTPDDVDHLIVAGSPWSGGARHSRRSCRSRLGGATISSAASATPARRIPVCCSPMCSTAPSRPDDRRSWCSPTGPRRWCCALPRRSPPTGARRPWRRRSRPATTRFPTRPS